MHYVCEFFKTPQRIQYVFVVSHSGFGGKAASFFNSSPCPWCSRICQNVYIPTISNLILGHGLRCEIMQILSLCQLLTWLFCLWRVFLMIMSNWTFSIMENHWIVLFVESEAPFFHLCTVSAFHHL